MVTSALKSYDFKQCNSSCEIGVSPWKDSGNIPNTSLSSRILKNRRALDFILIKLLSLSIHRKHKTLILGVPEKCYRKVGTISPALSDSTGVGPQWMSWPSRAYRGEVLCTKSLRVDLLPSVSLTPPSPYKLWNKCCHIYWWRIANRGCLLRLSWVVIINLLICCPMMNLNNLYSEFIVARFLGLGDMWLVKP